MEMGNEAITTNDKIVETVVEADIQEEIEDESLEKIEEPLSNLSE